MVMMRAAMKVRKRKRKWRKNKEASKGCTHRDGSQNWFFSQKCYKKSWSNGAKKNRFVKKKKKCQKLSSFCGVTRSLFDVVFPETFMITFTFGASIAVWFMKTSVISDCTVWSFANKKKKKKEKENMKKREKQERKKETRGKKECRNDKLLKNVHFCLENKTGEAPSNVWFSWEQSAFSGCDCASRNQESRPVNFPLARAKLLQNVDYFPGKTEEPPARDLILRKRHNYL